MKYISLVVSFWLLFFLSIVDATTHERSLILDLHESVEEPTDSVASLKRLQQALHVLNLMEKAGTLVIPLDLECQERALSWCDTTFHSTQMVMCIDHLCIQKKLEPLFCVWSSLIFSKHLKKSVLLHEFTKAVIVLLYASLKEHFAVVEQKVLMRASFEMKHLDTLSLEELLVILDLLVDEIPDFLEKIELTNQTLTWHEWAKKYWLIAPVSAVIAGIKIYLSYLVTYGETKTQGGQV